MTRNVFRRILVAVAALSACDAHANTGIGLLVLAVPVTVVALVPAILIEAPILARFLRVSGRRALWISFVANVVSTIVGAIIALATSFIPLMYGEFMRETVLISLVPMFFVTWWLEHRTAKRMLPEEQKPLSRRATGFANLASYLVMLIGVAILVPPASAIFNRWRLSPALAQLGVARNEVAEYYVLHKTFPLPGAIAPQDPTVASLAREAGGRLVATLSFPGRPAGDGKRIVFEPVVVAGKISDWKCSSDIEDRYLPAQCRR